MAGLGELLGVVLAVLAPAFQDAETARASLAKSQDFLEAKPFHGAAFDRMVQVAVELGSLAELERGYTDRLQADAADRAARVVLARLYARSRRSAEALDLLAVLEDESAEVLHLRGRLLIARGELEEGALELERAATLSQKELERTEILTLAGRTWARLGREDAARASFRALAELAPESFELRSEIAALLAESGLRDLALEELELAVELARGDPERTVRAYTAIGRLQERRGRTGDAKRAYARAAHEMHAGHWMRRELLERRLALHRAEGSLEELVVLARGEVREAPSNPGARSFLAHTLVAVGREAEGLDVLATATRDFPNSRELGREYAQLLAASGRADDAVVEYQRLAGLHPDNVRPQLEAGTLLAALGQREAALGQWRAALERRPKSVELRIEVARLQQHFGLDAEGDALLAEAIRLAPDDLRPVNALVESWSRRGVGGRAATLLAQVQLEAVRRGDGALLEELAYLWLDREDTQRAMRAIEQALEAGGERKRLLLSLVTLLEETGPFEREAAALDELFRLANGPDERFELSARITHAHARAGRLAALERQAERRARQDPQDLHDRLLLARVANTRDEGVETRALLDALLAEGRFEEDALLHLAWHHASHERIDEAVASLRRLQGLRPDDRYVLEEIARLHRRADDTEALLAVQEELLRSNPTDRRLLTDLAEAAVKHDRTARAVELYGRVVELYPRDDEARLALGSALFELGRSAVARDEIAPVARSVDVALRAKARRLFRDWMSASALPEIEAERLQEQMLTEPERFELGVLAAYLTLEVYALETAQTIADGLGLRFPREPAVLELREKLRGLTLASTSVPFDTEAALREAGDARQPDLELAELLVAQGEGVRARQILMEVDAPVVAANLFLARGEPAEARRLLKLLCRRKPDEPELWIRLSIAYLAEGREGWAARALDDALAVSRNPWALLLSKARLNGERGYRHGVREAGEELLAKLDDSRALLGEVPDGRALHRQRVSEVASLHDEYRLDFPAAAEAILTAYPKDVVLLDATLDRMGKRDSRRARRLIERAQGAPPKGWERGEWDRKFLGYGQRFPDVRGGRGR